MKKYLLIAVSVVFCLNTVAKNVLNVKSHKASRLVSAPAPVRQLAKPTQTTAELPVKAYSVSKENFNFERKQALKRAESTLEADYATPSGELFLGFDAEWMGYTVAILQTHALNENVIFKNYSYYDETQPVTFKWTRSGNTDDVEMEQDADNNGIGYLWGASLMPTLTVTQGDASSSYSFQTTSSSASTQNAYWYAGMSEFEVLGNACPGINAYSGYSGGIGYTTQKTFYGTEQKAVGLASVFDAPTGVIYTDKIVVNGWFEVENGDINTIMGNNVLTATVFTFDGSSWVEYAVGYCDKESTYFNSEYGSTGLEFVFVEEDALFGTTPTPITLPQEDFMVTITGFEKIEAQFTGLMTAVGNLGIAGHAYAILEDSSLATIGYSNYPDIPQNELFIQFNAIEAVAEVATYDETLVSHDVIQIPAEGGYGVTVSTADGTDYNDFVVYTESPIDEWDDPVFSDESMSDWLQVSYDDDEFENENVISFYFSADALPSNVEGRGGYVTLVLYGNKITVAVTQGNYDIAGVKGVETDKTEEKHVNAPAYNLAGQRVNNDFRGLVIKNGRKFMNK